jgi:isoleucyl-tRNA synthetase
VAIEAGGESARLLGEYRDFLPTLFGVSGVDLKASGSDEVTVAVDRADGTKCERCWRYVPQVNGDGLCPRCVEALAEPVSL